MSVLRIDRTMKDRLASLKEQTELQDDEGNVVGVFIPADPTPAVDYTEVRKLFDPEEIKRRKERSRNDPGKPLAEIIKRLESLEQAQ